MVPALCYSQSGSRYRARYVCEKTHAVELSATVPLPTTTNDRDGRPDRQAGLSLSTCLTVQARSASSATWSSMLQRWCLLVPGARGH